ncbi:MAG: hypothetical protein MZV49_02230 [Rhodopseudomonas palustris]|nr:hypothetical protein [Rhodopseudomonas palustris]
MADYYPLIARAIAGLDPNAPGEARRALYERARTALIAQLRSVQPPLSESEITRERLALEEAVRKVEAEAAQRARDAARTEQKNRARPGDAMRPGDARPGDTRPGEAARRWPPDSRPSCRGQPVPMRRAANRAGPAARGLGARAEAGRSCRSRSADPSRAAAYRPACRRASRNSPALRCAASAMWWPMPTISAAPPPRPIAPRARPTCQRRFALAGIRTA